MIVWSAHGILWELDQVNNASGLIGQNGPAGPSSGQGGPDGQGG